jgi:DNA-binding transcriptional MerR regulator
MEIIKKALGIANGVAGDLLDLVTAWRDNGVSDEEIGKRLDDPDSALEEARRRAAERRAAGEAYLGREPK